MCVPTSVLPFSDDNSSLLRYVNIKLNIFNFLCRRSPLSTNSGMVDLKPILIKWIMNWSGVQRMNVVNNVDILSLRAPCQNGPYKNKHTEQHKNTQNSETQQTFRKHFFVCVFRIFLFLFFIYD